MSIINEALKKADYLKKWKSFHNPSFSGQSGSATITVKEIPSPASESPEVLAGPPFRVYFDSKIKSRSLFQLSKIALIIFFLVFVACSFFVLILGPWFFMWTESLSGHNKTDIGATQAVVSSPLTSAPVAIVESARLEPSKTEESEKVTFKKYAKPNARVSVKPIPRSLQHPSQNLVYRLTGISILGETDRIAIINGKVLEVGGKIGEAEVLSIEEKKVTLKKADKEFSLTLD